MKLSYRYSSRPSQIFFVAMLLPVSLYQLNADIHKCVTDTGIEYSDTHCSAGILVKHTPGYRTIGTIEGLTQGELESLQAMEKAYRKSRIQADKNSTAHKKQLRKDRARKRQDRARSCASAIKGLEQVRTIKRKGYSAKQSANLDARQDKLNVQKRENCS